MISEFDVFGYTVGYAHGEYMMSGDRVAARQTGTLVRLTTDDGLVGWGEITPLGGTYLPTFTGGVRAALELLGPELIGADPTNLSMVHRIMDTHLLGQTYAKSAIDIACWDLCGQRLGQPIAALLGGVMQPDYPIYEPVPLRTPEEMADYIRMRRQVGINRFQLKVGNDPYDDAARSRAAVEAGGDDTLIVADSNGGWNLLQAQVAVRELEGLPIYLEQPCRTTEDCINATRHSSLPLILDESIVTSSDVFEAKQRAGAVSINVKISRVGGLTKAAKIRDLMQDLNMMVSLEDMWGGDIIATAVSHLAASTQPEKLFMVPNLNELTSDGFIAGHTPRSIDGRVPSPTKPGLGITVDSESLGEPIFSVGHNRQAA